MQSTCWQVARRGQRAQAADDAPREAAGVRPSARYLGAFPQGQVRQGDYVPAALAQAAELERCLHSSRAGSCPQRSLRYIRGRASEQLLGSKANLHGSCYVGRRSGLNYSVEPALILYRAAKGEVGMDPII